MDKISELLKEARPLYIKRKRNKQIIKNTVFVVAPIMLFALAVLPFTANFSNEQSSYYTSSTSIVEQMGFPTDDYGLLKVD